MRHTRWVRAASVGLAASLLLAACSGGRNDDNASTSGGGSSTGSTPSGTTASGKSFTIATSECDYQPTQGVTDSEIKLGVSLPQSGLYGTAFAPIAKGYQAFFDNLNANGGIGGRSVSLDIKDDAYNSSQTKSNTDELVAAGVFGMFNVVGTPNNLAIRDDLNEQCIPDLFVATGSQLWGQADEYPWLIGSIPSYATEAAVFADYLKSNEPNAKVGILKQNDDFGEGYVSAFTKAIEGTDITIVGEQTYDSTAPDTTSQITELNAAGADTLLLAATALACPNSLKAIKGISGWDPVTYISATCTSKTVVGLAGPEATTGVLSSIYLKDPADPSYDDDPAMQEFKSVAKAQGLSDEDLTNGLVVYGWTMGQLLADTIEMAPAVERAPVMETAYTLTDLELPLLLPGVTVNTNGAEDPFPIETLYVAQYNGEYWDQQGEAVSFEGKTMDFVG